MDVSKVVEWYKRVVSPYNKTVAAAVAAVGTIVSFLADSEFSQNDLTGTIAALAGVYAVYQARNKPKVDIQVNV